MGFKSVIKFSPKIKKLILIFLDFIIINLSVAIGFWLSNQNFNQDYLNNYKWIFLSLTCNGVLIYNLTGYYRGLSTYAGSSFVYKSSFINFILILSTIIFGLTNRLSMPSNKLWIITYILIFGLNGLFRIFIRDYSRSISLPNKKPSEVVIYGAGNAGAQLINSIKTVGTYKIRFVVDDNKLLWNREINGNRIYSSEYLKNASENIDYVLFAIPSMPLFKKKQIIYKLQSLGYSVLQVPSLEDIEKGKTKLENLIPVEIDSLLEREAVEPIPELLKKEINNSVVLVTGAGGSIGSEISLQVISTNPKKIILFDSNERNLFEITNTIYRKHPKISFMIPVLGDCCNENLIKKIIEENKVEIIFHACAYKHVNIVERNPIQGLYNNVISTLNICKSAVFSKVKKTILISSDKAVRPTNVMGASKRISELLFQAYDDEFPDMCFSMVRFGNVLNSSGSVVPLFREQIKRGGPVSITHPEVIRYFMTIKEASQLVIQSSALAKGGEVFLLDMGEPIKVLSLAKQMINLSGLTIKDKDNKQGDIEMIFTGLRSGEKLFEELLIDNFSKPTSHPLIYKAEEKFMKYKDIIPLLEKLIQHLKDYELENALDLVKTIVPEWIRSED